MPDSIHNLLQPPKILFRTLEAGRHWENIYTSYSWLSDCASNFPVRSSFRLASVVGIYIKFSQKTENIQYDAGIILTDKV